jgi:hypothetical protein
VHHVTFGAPFVELNKTFVDAPIAQVVGRGGREVEMPSGEQRRFTGRSGTWLLDTSKPKVWFTIYNPDYPVLLGYIFQSAQNSWVLDWQENMRVKEIPWDGKVVARGICIGDSPFAAGLPHAVNRGSLSGVPVFTWISARERKTQRYVFFLAEIPAAYKGVAELRTDGGKITIVERETGNVIPIKSALPW